MIQSKRRQSPHPKEKGIPPPRLVATTTPAVKDWLKRAAEWATERLRTTVRDEDRVGILETGRLKVTESDIIRRAVERELVKMQRNGAPGPNPDLNSS